VGIVGLATIDICDRQCELVTLDAFHEGQGVGSLLLNAVTEEARRHECRRLWLITTNDNLGALRFYQRRGLRLVAVHRGAVDEARSLKPSIALVEIELGYRLARGHWGEGFANEAEAAWLAVAFGHLQLERIVAVARAQHVASQRVMKKIGMTYEGTQGSDVVYAATRGGRKEPTAKRRTP
jgi:RimJ/RimL family protein N-acetyltransferase